MKCEIKDNTLTLFFEGELNSFNADGIEKEIEATLNGKSFSQLILNFESLKYISSAGLRIILKLKQKYNDVSIIEASLEVYDVLSMTGFVNMMSIKKALKRVYVDGAQVIGEGFFSTVYRIDKDTIIKVFNRTSDPDQIDRELALAKQAFVLGIPTAISFDIVKVGEKLGVRFEMLDCVSLKDVFLQKPEKFDELIDRYVALLTKINTTKCDNPIIPNIKTFFIEKLEKIKDKIDDKHYQKAFKLLQSVPDRDTFVHGDCHFKNIMVQGDELLLIDMDTLSVGHPIFELASICAPYIAFELDDPGNNERFLGVPSNLVTKIYNELLRKYIGKDDQAIKDKIMLVCQIHMMWWVLMNTPDDSRRFEGCKARLIKLLDQYDDLEIGK